MTFLEERDFSNTPLITDYYKGKTIFITGGSGFMGKVLVEKLLYSCTDLDRIYLLLRSKKGVEPDNRLAELYKHPCFERLRLERPGMFESKVYFIAGDVSELSLGMSDEDRTLIVNKTNIIFHVAASVRFDDHLVNAVKLNLQGTKEVIDLAKDVRNLEVVDADPILGAQIWAYQRELRTIILQKINAIIHVSTSYSNTNRNLIEEIIYPPLGNWRDTLEVCDKLDRHTIQVMTGKLLGDMPNTYVFTKQLAEHVVYEQKGQLPLVIVRPSIVVSSHTDPMPGYIENFNGPNGLIVGCGKGIIRVLYSDPDVSSDYIPVDMSIKGIIVAAWARGTLELKKTDDIPIYNHCSGDFHPLTNREMMALGNKFTEEMPLNNMLWVPGRDATTCKTEYIIKVMLFHILPAILLDTVLRIIGRKPLLLRIQRRIFTANLALGYYTTQQWKFTNKNFMNLRSKIKEQDLNQFYYPLDNIDRFSFYKSSLAGGKKYLLKESEEDLPKAKIHYQRIVILDKITKFLFYGLLLWWICNNNYVKYIFNSIINAIAN